jgi:hypothetical protein
VYFPVAEILQELFSYHGQVPAPLLSMCHKEVDIEVVQIDTEFPFWAPRMPWLRLPTYWRGNASLNNEVYPCITLTWSSSIGCSISALKRCWMGGLCMWLKYTFRYSISLYNALNMSSRGRIAVSVSNTVTLSLRLVTLYKSYRSHGSDGKGVDLLRTVWINIHAATSEQWPFLTSDSSI